MKNIILLLTLALFTNLINAQEKKEYYDNGQLKSIKNYVDTIEHGSFIWYYKNGNVSAKGTKKNGERDGEYWSYNKEGLLEEYSTYKNGYKEGPFKTFWETGELKEEGTYRKNVERYNEPFRIGVYKKYMANGEIAEIGKFGIDEDNNEKGIGEMMYRTYYETDDPYSFKIKEEAILLDGEYHGICMAYYENGELAVLTEYNRGNIVGKDRIYYENGKLKFQGDCRLP